MTNLIESLQHTLGLSSEQISAALLRHDRTQSVSEAQVVQWLSNTAVLPNGVKRAAALVVIEQWLDARDNCGPAELLAVDKKYTRLLRDFSMAEIIALRKQLVRTAVMSNTGAS